MLTLVREKFPNTSLTDKDIYNRRYEIEKVEREGYYDIASLVQRIRKWCVDEEGGDYELFWLDNDKTVLGGALWVFLWQLQMWKHHYECTSLYATYDPTPERLLACDLVNIEKGYVQHMNSWEAVLQRVKVEYLGLNANTQSPEIYTR